MRFCWKLLGRADCLGAAARARESSIAVGWPLREAGELALVVAELTSNAIRHAAGGECVLELDRRAWSVTVRDEGPGFPPAVLLDGGRTDGVMPRIGLGSGLAGARRLSTGLVVQNLDPRGALVVAHKQR